MRARVVARVRARQEANAAPCRLPLADYLALPRRERKRRVKAARGGGYEARPCGCRWRPHPTGGFLFDKRCEAHAPMCRSLEQWEVELMGRAADG